MEPQEVHDLRLAKDCFCASAAASSTSFSCPWLDMMTENKFENCHDVSESVNESTKCDRPNVRLGLTRRQRVHGMKGL